MKHYTIIFSILALLATAQPYKAEARRPEVRNVILMIGDGMGLSSVTGLMVNGGYKPINMQRATATGFVTTYSANNRVTDSAAAATAFATGHKTNNSMLSVARDSTQLETIFEQAERRGMATGVVVTCYLPHATPAAFYAHSIGRYNISSISSQLIASGIDVAFGGGDSLFTSRKDGRNLLDEARAKGYTVVDNISKLDTVHSGQVLAVYPTGRKHMPFELQGRGDYLPRATAKALEILGNDSPRKGFIAMVEGSLIDYGSHGNDTKVLFSEMADFDRAVGVAMDYADSHKGTLLVVLADHETGGLSINSNDEDFSLGDSGVSYSFSTGSHTGTMVPMFAYGAGAEHFTGIVDNTEVNALMRKVLGLDKTR